MLLKGFCVKKEKQSKRSHLFSSECPPVPSTHQKALSQQTYGNAPEATRFPVREDQVSWKVDFPGYKPVNYTAKVVIEHQRRSPEDHKDPNKWADPLDFNSIEKEWLQRVTFCAPSIGKLRFPKSQGGLPQNPVGRTGMTGRGLLGKWGPNQAADPIVTCLSPVTGKLMMVAIARSDTLSWAIPGGMVDDGEVVSKTLIREFREEAAEETQEMKNVLKEVFSEKHQTMIFRGYVDDPRNTDNAWMETTVVHFHCPSHLAERLRLSAGDDAIKSAWLCIEDDNPRFENLYASHKQFAELAAKKFRARTKKRSVTRPAKGK